MSHTLVWSTYPQRSPEWFAERLGCATGSQASAVVAQPRKGQAVSTTRRNYLYQTALEDVTKRPQPQYDLSDNPDVLRGEETEPVARDAYSRFMGLEVVVPGFARCVEYAVGCSLDGTVVDAARRGFIEIKCPRAATHIGYIEEGVLPSAYRPQIAHNFFVTGADFCDFVSYNAEMPPGLDLFVVRVERAAVQAEIEAYRQQLFAFLTEKDALVCRLKQMAAKRLAGDPFTPRDDLEGV